LYGDSLTILVSHDVALKVVEQSHVCEKPRDIEVVDNRAMVNVCVVDNKYW